MDGTYLCGVVVPTRNTILLVRKYKAVEDMHSMAHTKASEDEIAFAINAIAKQHSMNEEQKKSIKPQEYTLTGLHGLADSNICEKLKIRNLSEMLSINSLYDSVTPLKVIGSKLAEVFSTAYSDLCFSTEVAIMNEKKIDFYCAVIFAPMLWAMPNTSVPHSLDDKSLDILVKTTVDVNDVNAVASAINNSPIRDGLVCKVVDVLSISDHIPPIECELINTVLRLLRKVGQDSSQPYDDSTARYMDIHTVDRSKGVVLDETSNINVSVVNRCITIKYTEKSSIINDTKYAHFLSDSPMLVRPYNLDFNVLNPQGSIIYVTPSLARHRFFSKSPNRDYIINADITDNDHNASVIVTSNPNLITKYKHRYALLCDQAHWERATVEVRVEQPMTYPTLSKHLRKHCQTIEIDGVSDLDPHIRVIDDTNTRRVSKIMTQSKEVKQEQQLTPDVDHPQNEVLDANPKLKKLLADSEGAPSQTLDAHQAASQTMVKQEKSDGATHPLTYQGGKPLPNAQELDLTDSYKHNPNHNASQRKRRQRKK